MGCGGAQAKKGQQNPMHEGHGLDPAGEGGTAHCRGATPDLCFNNIMLACIFLWSKKQKVLSVFSFKVTLGAVKGNSERQGGYCSDWNLWPKLSLTRDTHI